MAIVALEGTARLTRHGKRAVAASMYAKGKSFVAAAILLRQQGGYEYVVLHLLCQGTEIIVKALLLFKDYDGYHRQLKKPLGHDLEKIAATAVDAFGLRPLRASLAADLGALNALYRAHRLRYGTGRDLLVDPASIRSDRILRRVAAVIRLADSQLVAGAG
jgi:hypothetical protein